MKFRTAGFLALLLLAALLTPDQTMASRDRSMVTALKNKPSKKPEGAKKGDEKPFAELTKGKVKTEGLFDFYHDTTDNSLMMAIKPEQFDVVYLCGESRFQGDGSMFDNGAMGRTYPFYFKRVGKNIMLMERNLRFRADSGSVMSRSLPNAASDALLASAAIKSLPQDSTKAVLVDAAALLLNDPVNAGFFLNQPGGPAISFDQKGSYFHEVKSFPTNSEISVKLHYKTSQPQFNSTMQNPYSFFLGYNYSLLEIPKTDYVPRYGDDRVGFFLDVYQDYTSLEQETPYVRYVKRWGLKKKDPSAALSEPVKPIVYWIDNKVPEEYRPWFKEAIEFYNPAFEKIGFKNAIVAKQMPDTADWDPADARYSVIQWMVQPGASYAVGPSRSNPFTGEIFDADIRISADFLRFMYSYMNNFITPQAHDGSLPAESPLEGMIAAAEQAASGSSLPHVCNRADEAALDAAFAVEVLTVMTTDPKVRDSLIKEFVHAYTVEVVAHEVGHTLGFRHNFKASSIYTLEQIADRNFTTKNGLTGTIMDYGGPALAAPGQPQGQFYASIPGPYDDWLVEYGYSDFGAATPGDEREQLRKIASKSGDPKLVYATDEDAFGWDVKSIDPLANLHEMGADPLAYSERKMALTKQLWNSAIKMVEQPGARYQRIRNSFQSGWRSYNEAALVAPKFVGGLYKSRAHIGDPNAPLPFTVVPAAEQRRAVSFLNKHLFAADAFDFPNDLINKLQPEQFLDFTWSAGSIPTIDYPLHQMVIAMQGTAISRLYSPHVLGRLLNNLERFPEGAERYTMLDLFTQVRGEIWSELQAGRSVNSFRRQLQMRHLQQLIDIYLSPIGQYPLDARTLASNDLDQIERMAERLQGGSGMDNISTVHVKEVLRQIEAAKSADRSFLN